MLINSVAARVLPFAARHRTDLPPALLRGAIGRDLAAIVAHLSTPQQRALVDLVQGLGGVPTSHADAYERAAAILTLSEEAEALANVLLDGCGEGR